MRSLEQLRDLERAVIAGYAPAMAPERRGRFEDLGLLEGTLVRRERAAPLGDPVAYRVRGTLLCLRRCEARLILVRGGQEAA